MRLPLAYSLRALLPCTSPCVNRIALASPVVPDVSMIRQTSSSALPETCSRVSGAPSANIQLGSARIILSTFSNGSDLLAMMASTPNSRGSRGVLAETVMMPSRVKPSTSAA
jgi:hypothetical protein